MNLTAWLQLLGAYLIGSIPFGLFVGRIFYRSDIRQEGSGNIGAANALRSYGKLGGALVLFLDVAKGYVATFFTLPYGPAPAEVAGFCAVLGHCYSPFLNFKGGKGVATWLGVLVALQPFAALAFVVTWLAVVVPTRFASLGSLTAMLVSSGVLWWLTRDSSLAAGPVALAATALIFWKHRENIVRLREGRENKIGLRRGAANDARTLPG